MSGVDEFRLVTRRRRSKVKNCDKKLPDLPDSSYLEPLVTTDQLLRQVLDAVIVLRDSPYREVLSNGLTESLSILDVDVIPEIVCYGLGNFSHNRSAKYQLAVLLTLKSRYQSRVCLYDPVFYAKEIEVLKALDLSLIEHNEEAKRKIDDTLTLFYMPHCYIGLVANCIWANWNSNLSKCILLTNSFNEMAEGSVRLGCEDLKASVELIKRIHPYTKEISIDHIFHEALNAFVSTSIHVFPKEQLNNAPNAFWTKLEVPPFTFDNKSEPKKN